LDNVFIRVKIRVEMKIWTKLPLNGYPMQMDNKTQRPILDKINGIKISELK